MYIKKSKLWIMYISVVLFALCAFIGMSSILNVSAQENTSEQIQVYEDEIQSEDVNISSLAPNNSASKAIFLNLGSTRLTVGTQGYTQLYYIENANYFLANPLHRENTSSDHLFGTCTTVAHQILLGYHNYYSDRRLIPEKSSDGTRYLHVNYGDLNSDPIFAYNPVNTNLGRNNIGTEDAVFYGIFNKAGGSFNLFSQTIGSVATAADEFLVECANGRTKNWTITKSGYNKQEVVAELNVGRPVIIGFDLTEGHSAHVVVAYGYATYNGEFCYITHYGWDEYSVQMLVPESWLGYQVTMQVDHTHSFVDTGNSINDTYEELNCTTCNCGQIDEIYSLNEAGNIITKCKYNLEGRVTIPSQINSQTIIEIAANAFANQTGITQITLPSTVTSIGNNAFKNCTSLTSIDIPAGVTSIGSGAFSGCSNLEITVSAFNPNFTVENNILYNKGRTAIVASGKIAPEIIIPSSVSEILPGAFSGNKNLKILHINNAPVIGDRSFSECTYLSKVYFNSFTIPEIDADCFAKTNIIAYVPYVSQSTYKNMSAFYRQTIDSIGFEIKFSSDGQISGTRNTYYGEFINDLPVPEKTGFDFCGWYDSEEYNGEPYQNGEICDLTENKTLYAKWREKQFQISFTGEQSAGLEDKIVTYNHPIGELPNLQREGYTFLGWKTSDGEYYTPDTVYAEVSDITLISAWDAKQYTVTLNPNGGVLTGPADFTVTYDQDFLISAQIRRNGYIFEG